MGNKKQALISLGLAMTMPFLAITVALAVHGEEPEEMPANRLEMKEQVQQRMGEARAQMTELMEKTREQRLEALKKLMAAQIRRAENALARLNALLVMVESRREKLSGEGANLDAVDGLIADAKEHQEAAGEAINKAKADYEDLEGSETPRQAVQAFMRSMKALKAELISFHRTMMQSVKAMRQAVPKPDDDSETNGSQEESDGGETGDGTSN